MEETNCLPLEFVVRKISRHLWEEAEFSEFLDWERPHGRLLRVVERVVLGVLERTPLGLLQGVLGRIFEGLI